MDAATLNVRAVAWTWFDGTTAHELTGWAVDEDADWTSGSALAEFAGRACYQSWKKPNPATATNAGYLAHIRDVGHMSVLEHATVTFYLTGVSRSLTHELVRHRHLSYSQLSQRYVAGVGRVVEPPVIAEDPYLHGVFTEAMHTVERAYGELLHALERKMEAAAAAEVPGCPECGDPAEPSGNPTGWYCLRCYRWLDDAHQVRQHTPTSLRKQARQAARAVLPNAAETRIVVTGNYRAWRHFVDLRATEHADVEIRQVAVAVLRELQRIAPPVFADYTIGTLPDGTEVALSPFAERS
jgi:thymidylate synthase (FAD)